MGRKRERRARRPEGFSTIPNVVIDSPAYANLRPVARVLLVELARLFTPSKNGRIFLDCRMAATRCRCNRSTVLNAFGDLVEHGFISLERDENYIQGKAREWSLTFEMKEGRAPTDLWLEWRPAQPVATLPARKPRKVAGKARSETGT